LRTVAAQWPAERLLCFDYDSGANRFGHPRVVLPMGKPNKTVDEYRQLVFTIGKSLVVSTGLTAFGNYLDSILPFGKIIMTALNVVAQEEISPEVTGAGFVGPVALDWQLAGVAPV
jgi:hypothetical protein